MKMDAATSKPTARHPKPKFDRDVIGELRRLVIAHNQATPASTCHVKLGQLKGLYKRYFNGRDPHAHALAKLDEHLERLHRRGEMPAAVKINALLFPDDFIGALRAARVKAAPDERTLFEAAAAVLYVAQKVVSAQSIPSIGQIRAVCDTLGEIELACLTVSRRIAEPSWAAEAAAGTLAQELSRSRKPVVIALLDAAASAGERDEDVAEALLTNAKLGSWAGAAREQFEVGLKREEISREHAAARSPARTLAFALIDSFVALTGEGPRFSREKPERGGGPGGPLIRYLTHLFERARHNLSLDPERAGLRDQRAWNPTAETLASWITQFRGGNLDL